MKLINSSTDKTISNNIYSASSFLDATFGLILRKNDDIFFRTRFGIHTFFMKDGIDVIVADKNFMVVSIKENFKPNKIFVWNPSYFNVFELKKNSIKKSKTRIGDKLKLI